jgi:hypothetical protein
LTERRTAAGRLVLVSTPIGNATGAVFHAPKPNPIEA